MWKISSYILVLHSFKFLCIVFSKRRTSMALSLCPIACHTKNEQWESPRSTLCPLTALPWNPIIEKGTFWVAHKVQFYLADDYIISQGSSENKNQQIKSIITRNWHTWLWRLTVPRSAEWVVSRQAEDSGVSSSPKASRLQTQEEPIFQHESKGRKKPTSQFKGHQEGWIPPYLGGGWTFCFIQAFKWLDKAHSPLEGQSALPIYWFKC